jgi:peptidase M1-like protein
MKTAVLPLSFLSVLFSYTMAFASLHHSLEITLTPAIKTLAVTDTVQLTPGTIYRFLLNKNLTVKVTSVGDQLKLIRAAGAQDLANEYELKTGREDSLVTLTYSGVIFDPVTNNDSTGLISPDGAALLGSTSWVPEFGEKTTYEIQKIALPAGWVLASPKAQLKIPQQDLYLIAGAFTEYDTGTPLALKVYLRNPDPQLAQTFLNLLPGYLDHYQQSLGAYPYDSFAVIENFWETGFGMPGFTLLGPGVIRLPYILNSSLPHELLHNWWGNSVFVDYGRGNWCEGLTTYMADHWQQELLKADREYRRQSLMNFQDYTRTGADFPLRDFKQRFNFSSQAVGYGKGMMLFHMLKVRLGVSTFQQALKDLYQTRLGQSISYEEIEKTFETTSGQDLKVFFRQWLDRTGAPGLHLSHAQVTNSGGRKYQVNFELEQGSSQNYELTIPVRFTFDNDEVRNEKILLSSARAPFQFVFEKRPQRLEIDPDVDVFRELDVNERPLGFSTVFGASQLWLTGDSSLVTAYQQSWQPSIAGEVKAADDKILLDLPKEGAVVMLGENSQYGVLMEQALAGQDFKVDADSLRVLGGDYLRKDFKTALVARSSSHPGLILVWIRGAQTEALAPRLLHYGKFSALAFSDQAVPLKATWPLLKSPLRVDF